MPDPISTADLAKRVDDVHGAPFILDVRAPEQFERWRIEGAADLDSVNIPYWTAIEDVDLVKESVPENRDVIVVCAHGGSSDLVVETVGATNMRNLAGGMDEWATTLVPRTLFDDGERFVIQFDRIAKACLSYAVGVRGSTMALIDPAADPRPYLTVAETMAASVTDVFDTHLHADHVSLGPRLTSSSEAVYRIAEGDADGASFDFEMLRDGQVFRYGPMEVVVRSVATPGHTPGSTSLEVDGRFLMTGDAVFVSGVGRPDLGGATEPWARDLHRTIHQTLAGLESELEVCPAHYTSRTEAGSDGTIRRNLGDLLANDPVVSMTDEEEFVAHVVGHLGEAPAEYATIRLVNLGVEEADELAIAELEVGRNECALSE